MPVYMIIDIKITNKILYEEYVNKAKPIILKYGAEYITQTNKITSISNNWFPERIVIIKFPSETKMKKCFDSEEYKCIAHLRLNSTESKAILVEGL